jgi:uncharacterized protein involved in exopolysaccharide biosynthesis
MASLGRSVGKWLVVVLVALGAVTGYVLSGLSPVYRSEARMQIVAQRIADEVVPIPADRPLADRLRSVTQTVLTRLRLERLIVNANLFASERRAGAIMQDLVELARKNASITVDTQRSGEPASSIVVTYTASEPRAAQQATEMLASFLIDESLKDNTRRAENTSDFVEAMVAEAERRLAQHDTTIAAARAGGGQDSGRMQIEAEVLRSSYKSWLERREQAAMRVKLVSSNNAEQFTLLEPARLPERAEGPTRRAASMAGAIAGLVLALIVNLFLAVRRPLAARATVAAES